MANAQTYASFGPQGLLESGMLCSTLTHGAVFMCIKINTHLSKIMEFHGMGAHLLDGSEGFASQGESCCSPCAGGSS